MAPVGRVFGRALSARLFAWMLGLGGVIWGTTNFLLFWRHAPIESVAARIVSRDAFKADALAPLMPEVIAAEQDGFCRPEALHAAAIVRLRLTEQAMLE